MVIYRDSNLWVIPGYEWIYKVGPPNDSKVGEHNSYTVWFMELITIVHRAYKPTYNWGPHIVEGKTVVYGDLMGKNMGDMVICGD